MQDATLSDDRLWRPNGAFIFTIPLVIALLMLMIYMPRYNIHYWPNVDLLALICVVYCGTLLLVMKKFRIDFTVVIWLYLTLTTLGSPMVKLLYPAAIDNFEINVFQYFTEDINAQATLLGIVGVISYTLISVLVVAIVPKNDVEADTLSLNNDNNMVDLFYTSILLHLLCLGYLLLNLATGTLSYESGYSSFVASRVQIGSYIYFLMTYQTALAITFVTGSRQKLTQWGWIPLLVAIILLLTGNRGEILYSLAASIGALTLRGVKFNRVRYVVPLLAGFSLIAIVRQVRNFTIEGIKWSEVSFNPVQAILEIGLQHRTLSLTVNYVQDNGLLYGQTITLPMLRLLRFLPFDFNIPSLANNPAFIRNLSGHWAYSIVADSYINFGLIGIVIILGLIAIYIEAIASRVDNLQSLAFHTIVVSLIVTLIRSSFNIVPVSLAIMLAIFLIANIIKKFFPQQS